MSNVFVLQASNIFDSVLIPILNLFKDLKDIEIKIVTPKQI